MNTFKMIGFAGVASVALAISANSPTVAETQPVRGAVVETSNNLVHRVSYSLAAEEQYTESAPSGYKWAQKAQESQVKDNWSGQEVPSSYKWGKSIITEVSVSHPASATSNYAEQARNPWGRKDFSEQARNPWGRR